MRVISVVSFVAVPGEPGECLWPPRGVAALASGGYTVIFGWRKWPD